MLGLDSHVLRAENDSPWTCGMLYKAIQVVLLHRSEMWSLSSSSIKQLEGFHIPAEWQMPGLWPEKKPNSSWLYPGLVDVLKAADLQMIAHFMDVWRQLITNFIVN